MDGADGGVDEISHFSQQQRGTNREEHQGKEDE